MTLAFGPLAYRVARAHVPPRLAPFWREDAEGRRVEVVSAPAPPSARPTLRAALLREADADTVFVRPPDALSLTDGLCTLVSLDAPSQGCVLVHAAAITTPHGLALLVGPPGVGKSTLARRDPRRAFAFNSVLLHTDGRCWPMPFAGVDDDPWVAPSPPQKAAALIELVRSDRASVECLSGVHATVTLTRACVRPTGADPAGAERARCVFVLAGSVVALRLGLTDDPGYLAALDSALQRMFADDVDC